MKCRNIRSNIPEAPTATQQHVVMVAPEDKKVTVVVAAAEVVGGGATVVSGWGKGRNPCKMEQMLLRFLTPQPHRAPSKRGFVGSVRGVFA